MALRAHRARHRRAMPYILVYTARRGAGARQRCGRARTFAPARTAAEAGGDGRGVERASVGSLHAEQPAGGTACGSARRRPGGRARAEVTGVTEQLEVGLRVGALAEAEAGVDPGPRARPPGSAASRSASSAATSRQAIGAALGGEHLGERAAAQVAGDVGRPRGSPIVAAISGSNRPPETSLTIVAPAATAARATSALVVSIETVRAGRARAARSPGARGAAPRRRRPASPAGWSPRRRRRGCRRPRARAGGRARSARVGVEERPPSENESGVTLTTPMTAGRRSGLRHAASSGRTAQAMRRLRGRPNHCRPGRTARRVLSGAADSALARPPSRRLGALLGAPPRPGGRACRRAAACRCRRRRASRTRAAPRRSARAPCGARSGSRSRGRTAWSRCGGSRRRCAARCPR